MRYFFPPEMNETPEMFFFHRFIKSVQGSKMNDLEFAIQNVLAESFQRVLVDVCVCHGKFLQCVGIDEAENRGFDRRQAKII